MTSLNNIVNSSGDSILREYSYSKGILSVTLNLTEFDKYVKFSIKTDYLAFDNFYIEKNEYLYRVCRIEIQELLEVISVENGFYVPSNTFSKLMKEAKLNYNLAYGKKTSELKYIFSVKGYGQLISCLLFDLNSIKMEEIYLE